MSSKAEKKVEEKKIHGAAAFTLIELLVVIAIIGVLAGLLMPVLGAARAGARAIACRSNIHQLLLANIGYATDNDGFLVTAAADMLDGGGLRRWHGVRNSLDEAFEPSRGPLAAYIANGRIKECPEKTRFIQNQDWNANFEQGCGGYGYNMMYLGSRLAQNSLPLKRCYSSTASVTEILTPSQTLMFADCAMGNDADNLIEYSFAEPPFSVYNGKVITSFYMSPSIHFRHRLKANIGWCDGHTSSLSRANFDENNAYGVKSSDLSLGWFEPVNNSPFDLK